MNLGLQRGVVKLVEHDESWHTLFLFEKEKLQDIFGSKVLEIEHVGSTAINKIKAKPILDLMIGVENLHNPDEYNNELKRLDYIFREDFRETQGHLFYVKGPEENRTHYLKITTLNSDFWKEHIIFRDFLNANPMYAREYEDLKIKLLTEHRGDRGPYTEGKEFFVKKVLGLAGYKGKIL